MYAAREGKADCVRLLGAAGADAHRVDPETKFTPMLYAAWNGHTAVVQELTALGVPTTVAVGADNLTALTLACKTQKPTTVAQLLAAGARVTSRDVRIVQANGCTAIEAQFVRHFGCSFAACLLCVAVYCLLFLLCF